MRPLDIPLSIIISTKTWEIIYPDGRIAECDNYKVARMISLQFNCGLRPKEKVATATISLN